MNVDVSLNLNITLLEESYLAVHVVNISRDVVQYDLVHTHSPAL